MNFPSEHPAPAAARNDPHCDLCGSRCTPDDWSDAAGMVICPRCIEEMLDASTFNARSEMGLVGASR
jgi:formylmethanofuran dehydrogenase subunit E